MSRKLSSAQYEALRWAVAYGARIAPVRTVRGLVNAGLAEPGKPEHLLYPTPAGLAALEQHEARR